MQIVFGLVLCFINIWVDRLSSRGRPVISCRYRIDKGVNRLSSLYLIGRPIRTHSSTNKIVGRPIATKFCTILYCF